MRKVALTGRAGAIFTSGTRVMDLDGELMASGDEWILFTASVGLWSDGTEATSDEKKEVIREVVDLLAREGVRVVVE